MGIQTQYGGGTHEFYGVAIYGGGEDPGNLQAHKMTILAFPLY